MLSYLLITLVFVPVAGFIGCILMPRKWERAIFLTAITTMLLELVIFFSFGDRWLSAGAASVATSVGSLFSSHSYSFDLKFYFDNLADAHFCIQ
jgi:hypothetical protein